MQGSHYNDGPWNLSWWRRESQDKEGGGESSRGKGKINELKVLVGLQAMESVLEGVSRKTGRRCQEMEHLIIKLHRVGAQLWVQQGLGISWPWGAEAGWRTQNHGRVERVFSIGRVIYVSLNKPSHPLGRGPWVARWAWDSANLSMKPLLPTLSWGRN